MTKAQLYEERNDDLANRQCCESHKHYKGGANQALTHIGNSRATMKEASNTRAHTPARGFR